MSSREIILNAIAQNKPEEVPLEALSYFSPGEKDLTASFVTSLEGIGGRRTLIDQLDELHSFLRDEAQKNTPLVNGIPATEGYNLARARSAGARDLEAVQTAVLMGHLGVAENGAVWVTERAMGARILPFICRRLVLVLEERAIVATLHQAYEQLTVNREGYGVFIAGPSKTADIEQSLVIGAHGPLTLQVIIVRNKTDRI
jgi:L-lactate dehydrogenase complex protein LldG